MVSGSVAQLFGVGMQKKIQRKTTALRCVLLTKSPIQVVMLDGHGGLSV